MSKPESRINAFFGSAARAERIARGLTQAQVVETAREAGFGLTVPMLSALENGRERWTASRLAALGRAFESTFWFLGRGGAEPPAAACAAH